MLNVAILAVLVILTAITSILAIKLLRVSREVESSYEKAKDMVNDYFNPRGDGQTSPFADTIFSISQTLGQSLATEIKNTFQGSSLAAAHQEKAILQDIAKDKLQHSNPLFAMILEQFPNLQKRLTKNPELLPMASEALGKLGIGAGDHNRPGESIDYGKALSKYK